MTFLQAYKVAIAADEAYHAALVAEYGPSKRRISEMRYRMHAEMDYPPAVRALWQAKRDADEAMRAALAAENAKFPRSPPSKEHPPMSDTYRSDPKRAAELAVILADQAHRFGMATPAPHKIADLVCDMQRAARSAKRAAENACNYPMTEAQQARVAKREERTQLRINDALGALYDGRYAPTIELGSDPRGPCARLHIPGQRGDGWGDGFAVY